ncbi:MAG: hypothetical protein D6691_02520 [Candidatus Hydrogenedentota bacterium]|jgi:signal transduction histidine kinase|uniref:histidine kinase n=1 Tax=Sumerlaea chitinivorans TaxID=2250252 RepID=A0A2Z4Y7G9_SUMC1|nr:putative two-component sensor histidine kinase [Candidatus Sumerlaea chitinivorans]RMH29559.1 MAG: hypothetical protein D6691_02520 [Candidatus Hydrogenedentota bacterium]
MMSVAPQTTTRWVYALAMVLLAASLAILWHLLTRFEKELQSNLERIQRVFSDETLLKNPGDSNINFGAIEELVEKYRGSQYVRSMTITKLFGKREHIVYPYYLPALFARSSQEVLPAFASDLDPKHGTFRGHPLPWRLPTDAVRLPLMARGHVLGYLYARVDRSPLRSVQLAIALLTVLLAVTISVFLLQFRKQASVISRTTIELEEKRQELVRLERLALAGQLSANILHDLKKPVLNIKSELEEFDADGQQQAPLAEVVQRMREQVGVFLSILREGNLERFVRGEGETEWLSINEAIERSLALVRYERGAVQHKLQLCPDLPPVFGVPVRLVQVFSNLILNAYQAMNGKGTLTIRTAREGNHIAVEISDTGPGIPAEALDKIFRPFYSTKPAEVGTGLGLYITRDIIEEMGGRIYVTSHEGGTTFRIEFPVV